MLRNAKQMPRPKPLTFQFKAIDWLRLWQSDSIFVELFYTRLIEFAGFTIQQAIKIFKGLGVVRLN
jgi:hypothetical protein